MRWRYILPAKNDRDIGGIKKSYMVSLIWKRHKSEYLVMFCGRIWRRIQIIYYLGINIFMVPINISSFVFSPPKFFLDFWSPQNFQLILLVPILKSTPM
jgi:hypothetical protein